MTCITYGHISVARISHMVPTNYKKLKVQTSMCQQGQNYILAKTSNMSHRYISLADSTCCLIPPYVIICEVSFTLSRHLSNAYYILGTLLGTDDIAVNRRDETYPPYNGLDGQILNI